ncbi:MAG: MotA/TolQ/ExbB proton channel family protein [Planctomycetaceae bacterium]|jgi:biopolymer transport protein ExbB|nr:MotA/TolQ/ExbB proton channel family protein [Planctomycetaceae bacterium]
MRPNKTLWFFILFFLSLCFLILYSPVGFSQDNDIMNEINAEAAKAEASAETMPASENSETAAPEKKVYLIWMVQSLGWFFTPVFMIISMSMVTLVVMNFLAVRQQNFAPKSFVGQFGEYLDAKQFQDAYEYARSGDCMIAKVLTVGLAKLSSGYKEAENAMQAIGEEETLKHEQRLSYIALIGKISPMIGLFGTVVGMIASFNTLASSAGQPPVNKLAEGIATALFTTEIGLAIAIPALVVYEILRNRLTKNLLDVSLITESLMSRFSGVSAK